MNGEIRYRFQLWGAETGNFYGDMPAKLPDCDEIDMAYELNDFYDRIIHFNKTFLNISEALRVEYVPDPVILRTVPNPE